MKKRPANIVQNLVAGADGVFVLDNAGVVARKRDKAGAHITKRTVDAATHGTNEKGEPVDGYLWDEDLAGFGLKTTPAGRKVYLLQYRMSGRSSPTRRYTIGKHGSPWTPDTARKRAEALHEQVKLGIDPMAEKQVQRENTVSALISSFIDDRRAKGRKSAEHVRRALKAHVGSAWGKRPAASITAAEAQKLVDSIALSAPIQANRIASHLKTMFRWAKRRGIVAVSPAADIEKPGQERSRDRAPSLAELVEIWRAADADDYPFGPALKMLILTGQRKAEVAGLRRSEILGDTWTIPGDRAKNGQEHVVHLTPLARALTAQCPRPNSTDLLFTTTDTRKAPTKISGWGSSKKGFKKRINKRIADARRKAGQPPMPHWTIHDLRRGVTTGLNNLGVAPHVADRILNHVSKTGGGVAAVYNRAAYSAERKAALKLWSDTLERALSG